MKSYEASADIAADPETIWATLVDGDAYTDWDSGVVRLEGRIAREPRMAQRMTRAASG